MKNLLLLFVSLNTIAQQLPVNLKLQEDKKMVEVTIDGKLFTNYFFPSTDELKKPVLYPVMSAGGNFVTRGWPYNPRPNERVDHPHHVGVWLNHGDINGNDFWNNSTAVDHEKHKYGTVVHTGILAMKSGKKKGVLKTTSDWIDAQDKKLLTGISTYTFSGTTNNRIIDLKVELTATELVKFTDNKEGLFAIRLARELEHPSKGVGEFTDANGVSTKVAQTDNTGVTGHYINDSGVEGEDVWPLRSEWMNLQGKIKDEDISLVIYDHPSNPNFPSHWHARGYGLYAVNPIGSEVFTKGKEKTDITLQKGQKLVFHYQLQIASEKLSVDTIKANSAKFKKSR